MNIVCVQIDTAAIQYICKWDIYRRNTKVVEIWSSLLSLTLKALSQKLFSLLLVWVTCPIENQGSSSVVKTGPQKHQQSAILGASSPQPIHVYFLTTSTQANLYHTKHFQSVSNVRRLCLQGVIPASQPSRYPPDFGGGGCELPRAVTLKLGGEQNELWHQGKQLTLQHRCTR